MTSTMHDHTILPPTETEQLGELVQALENAGRGAIVLGDRETTYELPASALDVLREVVTALSRGYAITVVHQHTRLTTQEAADLLGVSRPTLVKLLEDGRIPFEKTSRHRRLRLQDVLDYQRQARGERAARLDGLAENAEKHGLYDATDSVRLTR